MRASKVAVTVLTLGVLLVSCGGGGDGTTSGSEPAFPRLASFTTGAVSLGAAIPDGARGLVAEVITPSGSAPIDMPLPGEVENGTEKIVPVYALDSVGNIVLAGEASESSTVLTAETTAIELTKLLITDPPNLSRIELNQIIRNASQFGNLVTAVDKALRSGTAPSTVNAVIGLAIDVFEQTAESIAERVLMASNPGGAKAIATPYVPVEGLVIFGTGSEIRDKVVGNLEVVNKEGRPFIRNSMSVFWDVRQFDYTGKIIPFDSKSTLNIGGVGFTERVVKIVAGSSSSTAGKLVNDLFGIKDEKLTAQQSFTLNYRQTTETRIQNLANLAFSAFKAFVPQSTDAFTCINSIVDDLESNTTAVLIASKGNLGVSELANFLFSYIKEFTISSLSEKCFNAPKKLDKIIGVKLRFVQNVIDFYKNNVDKAVKYGDVAVAIAQTASVWGVNNEVGSCMSPDGSGAKIVNCVARFKFVPERQRIFLGSGRSFPTIIPLDSREKATLVSRQLEFASDNESIVRIDRQKNRLIAVAEGTAKIQVRDPVTGTQGSWSITVGGLYPEPPWKMMNLPYSATTQYSSPPHPFLNCTYNESLTTVGILSASGCDLGSISVDLGSVHHRAAFLDYNFIKVFVNDPGWRPGEILVDSKKGVLSDGVQKVVSSGSIELSSRARYAMYLAPYHESEGKCGDVEGIFDVREDSVWFISNAGEAIKIGDFPTESSKLIVFEEYDPISNPNENQEVFSFKAELIPVDYSESSPKNVGLSVITTRDVRNLVEQDYGRIINNKISNGVSEKTIECNIS